MAETGLNGHVYIFLINDRTFDTSDITNINEKMI